MELVATITIDDVLIVLFDNLSYTVTAQKDSPPETEVLVRAVETSLFGITTLLDRGSPLFNPIAVIIAELDQRFDNVKSDYKQSQATDGITN